MDSEENMTSVEKYKAFYAHKPDAPIIMKEFGFYTLDKWKSQGYIKEDTDLDKICGYDEPGIFTLWTLGWCEAAFCPGFSEKVLEDRGDYEVVRDFAGRHVLYFKGRRSGFMPEYLEHPVKDMRTWEEEVKWRLDPSVPERYASMDGLLQSAAAEKAKGKFIVQNLVGGFMYLRSLMGAETLLLKFYDEPELIHSCMETWLNLADKVIEREQQVISLDEMFIGEDICYNVSSLISHDMIREFLFPYYQQLIQNVKRRQNGKSFHLQVDTDGAIATVIDLYKSIGFDYFSPFEVASGSDVVELGKKHPDILISGGFDKRIIAAGKEAIDREIDRILPVMRKRGGYIPTCDHGVPEEVEFDDYVYFRKRLLEFAK